MRGIIEFILYFLLLWGAALLVFGVKTFSFDSPLLLFVVMLGVGFALALIGKRWGRGMLLLAIPLAVVLAHLSAEQLWPPVDKEDKRAQVFRLKPEQNTDTATLNTERYFTSGSKNDRHDSPDFGVQTQTLALECADGPKSSVEIKLLTGVDLHPVACGLEGIEDIAFTTGSNPGVMFASLPGSGMVYRLERNNSLSNYSAEDSNCSYMRRKSLFRSGLDRPMGLEWFEGSLYVATRTSVLKISIPDSSATDEVITETIIADLPPASDTEYRALSIDADGTIYLSMGAGDARPQELEWQRAGILRITPTGETELYSTGLHHVRALERHPQNGELWALEDSPETLGFHPPPNEINILTQGGDYGWPFCFGFQVPDKDLGTTTICNATDAPIALLPSRSAPSALAFGSTLDAPERYRSMLYVALKGRVDDTQRRGFRVVGLPLDAHGDLKDWGLNVVSGLATPTKIYARPTALSVGPGGSLYLADAHSGMVYRFVFPFDADLNPASTKKDNGAAEQTNRKR